MTPPSRKTPGEGTLSPRRLFSSRLLILAALLSAGYLICGSLHGFAQAGCDPVSVCDNVPHSRWSSWLRYPGRPLADGAIDSLTLPSASGLPLPACVHSRVGDCRSNR